MVRRQEVKVIQRSRSRNLPAGVSAGSTYFTLLLDQPGAFPETMLLQWTVGEKKSQAHWSEVTVRELLEGMGAFLLRPGDRCSGAVRQVAHAGETPARTPREPSPTTDPQKLCFSVWSGWGSGPAASEADGF